MPRTLTAQDRASLIRLASSLPAGSPERKAILAGLKTSTTDFESYDWQGFDSVDYNEYPPERVSKELSAVKKKNREALRLVQNFLHAYKVLSAEQKTELLDLKAKSQVMENASDLQEELQNLVENWRNGK